MSHITQSIDSLTSTIENKLNSSMSSLISTVSNQIEQTMNRRLNPVYDASSIATTPPLTQRSGASEPSELQTGSDVEMIGARDP